MPASKSSPSTDGATRAKPLAGGSPLAAVALVVCGLLVLLGHPCTAAPQRIRLGIINAVTYHLEVLSGVVEAAKPFYKDVVVYVEPFTANGNLGWRKLVADYPGRILRTPTPGPHVLLPRHDVLFFVSPEGRLDYTRWFIQAARPSTVVVMLHSSRSPTANEAVRLHPNTQAVALSPHVVEALRVQRNITATWWLASKPYSPTDAHHGGTCACNGSVADTWGFACQGKIDYKRRSYGELWEELKGTVQAARDAGVGQGGDEKAGAGPEAVEERMTACRAAGKAAGNGTLGGVGAGDQEGADSGGEGGEGSEDGGQEEGDGEELRDDGEQDAEGGGGAGEGGEEGAGGGDEGRAESSKSSWFWGFGRRLRTEEGEGGTWVGEYGLSLSGAGGVRQAAGSEPGGGGTGAHMAVAGPTPAGLGAASAGTATAAAAAAAAKASLASSVTTITATGGVTTTTTTGAPLSNLVSSFSPSSASASAPAAFSTSPSSSTPTLNPCSTVTPNPRPPRSPHIKVLGKRPEGGDPPIPPELEQHVTLLVNAPYVDFYGHITCSLALLPLFADTNYYTVKFSSTIFASLATGTPMLVEPRFLEAYSFLNASHVFLHAPGEDLVPAMQRVQGLPGEEHQQRRKQVRALAAQVTQEASKWLLHVIATAPPAPPSPPPPAPRRGRRGGRRGAGGDAGGGPGAGGVGWRRRRRRGPGQQGGQALGADGDGDGGDRVGVAGAERVQGLGVGVLEGEE